MPRGTAKSTWTVGFDIDGNHCAWEGDHRIAQKFPATYTFNTVLKVMGYTHGRSAVTIILEDLKGHRYSMSLAEFMRIIGDLRDSRITGEWGFAKNGANTTLLRVN